MVCIGLAGERSCVNALDRVFLLRDRYRPLEVGELLFLDPFGLKHDLGEAHGFRL